MANVTVTLPLNTLDMLDDLVDKGKVGSRSQAVREALDKFLKSLELSIIMKSKRKVNSNRWLME